MLKRFVCYIPFCRAEMVNKKVLLRENERGIPPVLYPVHGMSCWRERVSLSGSWLGGEGGTPILVLAGVGEEGTLALRPDWGTSTQPGPGDGYLPPPPLPSLSPPLPGQDQNIGTPPPERTWDQRPGTSGPGYPLPSPDWQTHTCENSNFPHPSDAGGNNKL